MNQLEIKTSQQKYLSSKIKLKTRLRNLENNQVKTETFINMSAKILRIRWTDTHSNIELYKASSR